STSSALTVTVDYAVTGGTADGGGTDYTLASGQLSYTPGATSRNIPITIVNDTLSEGPETVVIALSSPTNASLGTTPHTFTIIDNDTTTVGFDQATSSANENAGSVNIPVTLSTSSALTVTVDYAVTGGTADGGGTDYTLASGQLSYTPGATSRNIPISIVNDTLSEGSETVVITLSSPTNATLGTTPHTFTIIDNDTTTVGFDQATSNANENAGSVNILVTLSTQSAQTVTVNYAATGGTAIGGGTDYTLASGQLSFSPGATSRNIPISVVNDTISENSETVVITLSSPTNATLGTTPHTFTIIDNDDTTVGFSQSTSNADEDAGTVNILVTLSTQSSQEVLVDYDVTGGTASGGGTDYTLANGTLTFPSGTTTRNIPITITDDLISESPETVQITLSNEQNASLGVSVHTFTINDNDETEVRFSQSASSADESAGSASITVTLSAQSSLEVEVDYNVTGGTATGGGTDYTLINGTLNFPPGTTSRNINISIVEDPISEGSETVRITLSNQVNATLGTSVHTFTINDNDVLEFETNVLQIVVPEGSTESFFVKLTAQPLSNVNANVNRISGDNDLSVASGASLTFTPANWEDDHEVIIEADDDPDVDDGSATFRISASGIPPKDILATEQDDALVNGSIQLVVSSQEGTSGSPLDVDVEIFNNKSSVSSFEFDFFYDDSMFTFEGSSSGALTSNWSVLNATETTPGRIDIQGTSGGGTVIPAFSNGSVITINLLVKCLALSSNTNTQLQTNNYINDFIEYSPEPYTALFTFRPCNDLGDVNDDGNVTPGDAQRAFEIFLGRLTPTFCQRMTANVNCDSSTTPGDAQWIFEHFLGRRNLPECCAEASTTSFNSDYPRSDDDLNPDKDDQSTRRLFALDTIGLSGEVVSIPIIVTNPLWIRSFGFDLAYPTGLLEFMGTGPCLLTRDFDYVSAVEESKGLIRVDGESQIPISSNETGSIVVLVFRVKKGEDTRLPLNILSSSGDLMTAKPRDGYFTRIREDLLDNRLLRFGEVTQLSDGTVKVPIKVSSAFNMKSFGLVLEYTSDNLNFMGVEKAKLSRDFIALDGAEMKPGLIKVGGYGMSAIQELNPGTLFDLIFTVTGGGGEIEMIKLLDDLQLCTIQNEKIQIH
ncbi:Calx-beta domain-containing protein, partial [Acidobacteriota bacterium]